MPNLTDAILVRLRFAIEGDAGEGNVVFGVHDSGSFDNAELAAIRDTMWSSGIRDSTSESVSLIGAHGQDAGGIDYIAGPPSTVAGGGATQASPVVTWLVRKSTDVGGRPGRGRMFWPGVAANKLYPSGSIHADQVASMQTAMTAALADLDGDGHGMLLLHPTAIASVVTALTVELDSATQRRRFSRL